MVHVDMSDGWAAVGHLNCSTRFDRGRVRIQTHAAGAAPDDALITHGKCPENVRLGTEVA